jgi:predicted dinucleotide-binding enzyme
MAHSNGASGTPDIGILGTGRMGSRLAVMFARAGRKVVLGSREPARAEWIAANAGLPALRGGTYDEALEAPAVLPAMFIRDGLLDRLESWRDRLAGKLLIDITNPFNDDYSDFLTPWDGSGAEEVRKRVPEARLVGAYKNVWSEVFEAPDFGGLVSDVLVTGDDDAAKQHFFELAAGTPFRYLDAGPLIFSRTVERLTLMTGRLGRQLAIYPRMNWRLLGERAGAAGG